MTLPIDVSVDRFRVSCLPKDHPDSVHYTLFVIYRRHLDGWVVSDGVANLDATGRRHYASVASESDRALYTFPTEVEALAVAQQIAPTLTVEGRSAADAIVGWTVPGAHAVGGES